MHENDYDKKATRMSAKGTKKRRRRRRSRNNYNASKTGNENLRFAAP